MIPNDIEWWISVNPYAIHIVIILNGTIWYSNIFQWQREALKLPVFHTDPHSSILVFTLTEATNMGATVPWHESTITLTASPHDWYWNSSRMLLRDKHVHSFSWIHRTANSCKIHELFSQVCQLKRFIWLHGTPHQRCQTELCPSHQSHLSMDPRSTNDQRLNLAAVAAQVWCLHPSMDAMDAAPGEHRTTCYVSTSFWGDKSHLHLVCSGWQFLVGAVRPIWPRKPRSSFPWLWVMPYKTLKIHDSFLNHLKLVAKRGWDNIQNQSWSCSTKRFGIPRHSDHIFGMPLWTLRKLQVLEDFKVWLGFVFANQTKRDSKT